MKDNKSEKQSKVWAGDFGKEYTDRNPQSIQGLDHLYENDYGITRRAMNEEFLADIDRSFKILEVGANIGLQLELLRSMGFHNLLGVEINQYAIIHAKKLHPQIDIIYGSAFDLPFRDGYFDLVFTSGVLIHIAPLNLEKAVREIDRVSSGYIWGFEYFAKDPTEINYRGNSKLLWKRNFADLYTSKLSQLKLVKEKKYKFLENDNVSQMFLLRKP